MRRIPPLFVAVTLLACGGAPAMAPAAALAQHPAVSEAFGLDAPLVLQEVSIEHAWVAACFLLGDSNGDGVLNLDPSPFPNSDQPRPFLLLNGRAPEPIDQYLGSSGDHRFVAILQAQRIWLIDVATQRRIDLTALGADRGVDDDLEEPPPAVSFSRVAPQAVFVRRSASGAEVISIELPSGKLTSLYSTTQAVVRTDFASDQDRLRVWLSSARAEDEQGFFDLSKQPCRRRLSSCRSHEPPNAIVLAAPSAELPPFSPEHVERHTPRECDKSGRGALASSLDGRHLLADAPLDVDTAHGPLWWFEGAVAESYCPPEPTASEYILKEMDRIERYRESQPEPPSDEQ